MPKDEIEALKQKFVEQLSPVGIYFLVPLRKEGIRRAVTLISISSWMIP